MTSSRRRWRSTLIYLLILLAVYLGARAWQLRGVAQGEPPPLAGELIDGRFVALADYRGRPLLLHFWASWCGICRAEQGSIAAIADDHQVLTVATRSGDAAALRDYMRREGVDFAVLSDPDGAVAARYGLRGVPTSLVLGTDGRIRFREVGWSSGPGLRLRLWLAGLGG